MKNDYSLRRKDIEIWFYLGMVFYGVLLFILPLAASDRDISQRRCELVSEAWMPSLNQAGDDLAESSKIAALSSQQALTG